LLRSSLNDGLFAANCCYGGNDWQGKDRPENPAREPADAARDEDGGAGEVQHTSHQSRRELRRTKEPADQDDDATWKQKWSCGKERECKWWQYGRTLPNRWDCHDDAAQHCCEQAIGTSNSCARVDHDTVYQPQRNMATDESTDDLF
jgi:hypothetical protein